jgi:hypothetical protein
MGSGNCDEDASYLVESTEEVRLAQEQRLSGHVALVEVGQCDLAIAIFALGAEGRNW